MKHTENSPYRLGFGIKALSIIIRLQCKYGSCKPDIVKIGAH